MLRGQPLSIAETGERCNCFLKCVNSGVVDPDLTTTHGWLIDESLKYAKFPRQT